MRLFSIFISLLILAGCSRYTNIKELNALKYHIGKEVVLEGKIVEKVNVHVINIPETHKYINFVSIRDNEEIVVYTREPINCNQKLKITGIVMQATEKRKPHEGVVQENLRSEFQVIADECECI